MPPSLPPATPAPRRIQAPTPPHTVHASAASPAADDEDPLAREAALVVAARGALARGDASTALRTVRTARALPSHQLVPEELAVEAQALRALGRDAEADRADATLRSQYPGAALAR
jgi:hypothetical protein